MVVNTRPYASSPLNPQRQQDKSSCAVAHRNWPRLPKSISPTEHLQRCKVADARRKHVLMQEAKAYEKAMVEAIRRRENEKCAMRWKWALDENDLASLGYIIESVGPEKYDDDEYEFFDTVGSREEQQSALFRFQLPDLSFLTPSRVVKRVGGWIRPWACERA